MSSIDWIAQHIGYATIGWGIGWYGRGYLLRRADKRRAKATCRCRVQGGNTNLDNKEQ